MRWIIFFFLFLLSTPQFLRAQDEQRLLQEAMTAEAQMQEDIAYQKYLQVVKIQPANITALCKCCELACKIGHRQTDRDVQVRYYTTARKFADLALKVNPASADANFAMSLAMGRMALVSSGSTLVAAVKAIKHYADQTVALNPADFRGYHVQGRWYYEISNLGAFKRTAVKLFYGAFPEASFEDARRCYEKSMQLSPAVNLNYLELAKVYIKLKEPSKAIGLLEKLTGMPLKMQDDRRILEEGRQLLGSLREN